MNESMIKNLLKNNHLKSIVAQVGSSGIAIISFIILTRTLSMEKFGQWGLYLALLTFVDMLITGLVSTALIKYSSGKSEEEKIKLLASSWIINICTVILITILFYSTYFMQVFKNESMNLFLFYYPIYSFISMPYHFNLWNARIEINISRILKIKIFNALLFLGVCIYTKYEYLKLEEIVIAYTITFAISSIVSIITGKTGINQIKYYSKNKIKKIIEYGKYHMLAFIGSNLLKSSDTFLISAFLGDKALAIYLIPRRLWILVVTPLASVNTISFPVFSANHNEKKYVLLKNNIEKYIGVVTILYIPFVIVLFMLSEKLVILTAGNNYIDSIIIFRIFLVYSIFVPFDQIIGVSLDAVNKPNKNFIKIMVMTIVNIIGDLIVLHYYKSLNLVAWVTLGTTLSGIFAGWFMLKKEVDIELKKIFKNSINEIKTIIVTTIRNKKIKI